MNHESSRVSKKEVILAFIGVSLLGSLACGGFKVVQDFNDGKDMCASAEAFERDFIGQDLVSDPNPSVCDIE